MEDPTIKERLLEFIKTMGLSVAQFERRAGLSNGYVRNFRGSFGGNKFDCILSAFPSLNRAWITTGRGNMFLDGVPTLPVTSIDDKDDDDDADTPAPPKREQHLDYKKLYEDSQKEIAYLRQQLETSQRNVSDLVENNKIFASLLKPKK